MRNFRWFTLIWWEHRHGPWHIDAEHFRRTIYYDTTFLRCGKKREDKTTKQNKLNNLDMLEVVFLWRSMSTVESYDNSDLIPMYMATFILMNCWCRWYKIKTSTFQYLLRSDHFHGGVWLLRFSLCTHWPWFRFFVRACLHKVSFGQHVL